MFDTWVKVLRGTAAVLSATLTPPLLFIQNKGLPSNSQDWATMGLAAIAGLYALAQRNPFQNTAPSGASVPPGASGT